MTEHPFIARAIARAAKAGSAARTARGAIRFCLASPACWRGKPRIVAGRWEYTPARRVADLPVLPLAEREDRRATADPHFRTVLIARIRTEAAALRDLPAHREDPTRDLQAAYAALAARLRRVSPRAAPLPPHEIEVLDLGPRERARAVARALGAPVPERRAADWTVRGGPVSALHEASGETEWRGGRPRHYTRAVASATVRAIARVEEDGALAVLLHRKAIRLACPDGARWHVGRGQVLLVADSATDSWSATGAEVAEAILAEVLA